VNINQSDAEKIVTILDRIGISRALAIVQYRDDHSLFYAAEELSVVKGNGLTKVERNIRGLLLIRLRRLTGEESSRSP